MRLHERYIVQRFQCRAKGGIIPVDAEKPGRKGCRRARGVAELLERVKRMRPARDEDIIAAGIKRRD